MVFDNQHSSFADRYEQYRTLVDCQAFCASYHSCIAVDFNSSSPSCWVHTDPSNLQPRMTFRSSDVTQLVIRRDCLTAPCRWSMFSLFVVVIKSRSHRRQKSTKRRLPLRRQCVRDLTGLWLTSAALGLSFQFITSLSALSSLADAQHGRSDAKGTPPKLGLNRGGVSST